MRWAAVAGLVAASVFTGWVWSRSQPVQPESSASWVFVASLLLLVAMVIWVWTRYLRAGRSTVPSLIERIPPAASWTCLVVFAAAVALYAVASLQYSSPLTGQLEPIGQGQYVRNNHGTLLPTTSEDYRRSALQDQRTNTTGTVAACALAVLVAGATRQRPAR